MARRGGKRGIPRAMKLEAMSRESTGSAKLTSKVPKAPMFPKDVLPKLKSRRATSVPKAPTPKFPNPGKQRPAKAKTISPPKPKKAK